MYQGDHVPLTPKKSSALACCITRDCCNIYNKIGIFLFVVWFVIQIVSVSIPWEEVFLARTYRNGDTEFVIMQFYPQYVSISHSINPGNSATLEQSVYKDCPYVVTNLPSGITSENILFNVTSTVCPPTNQIGRIFPTIIGTSAAAIVCEFIMILWLIYRTTYSGFTSLFKDKCTTQLVSFIIGTLIIAFSCVPYAFFADRGEFAIAADLGTTLLVSYGCDSTYSWKGLYCYSNYCSNFPYTCQSYANQVTGFIMSCANMGMLVVGVFYTWIGSWCCSCCCHELEENNSTTSDIQTVRYVTSSNNPYSSLRNLNTIPAVQQTYTLFVHHGGPFPTKMVVVASSLQEMEMIVSQNLGLSVPFKMAVFDDMAKQYVMVSSMDLISPQATIQLLFQ